MSTITHERQNPFPFISLAFRDHQVLGLRLDGEGFIYAPDVCRVLAIKDARHTLRRLREDEKRLVTRQELVENGGTLSPTVSKHWTHGLFLYEAGLYKLVMSSEKAEARAFKDWIAHEFLPILRQTGSYTLPGAEVQAAQDLLNRIGDPDALDLISRLAEKASRETRSRMEAEQQLAIVEVEKQHLFTQLHIAAPKVKVYDDWLADARRGACDL